MTKYRIQKCVMYHPEWGEYWKKPSVYYTIQWKCLWWWEKLDKLEGSDKTTFDSVEEAENALKTHANILNTLASNGKIEKVLKL